MTYKKIKVDDELPVNHNGKLATGKVRRIGPIQAQGFAMLTLDVGGEAAWMPAHETEIAEPSWR